RRREGRTVGIQAKLLIAMVLMLVLPLSVTAITWNGLLRMDVELRQVAEEFTEARRLQPVDVELSLAAAELDHDDDRLHSKALESLRRAEAALVQYLAEQYDDVSSQQHQEEEATYAANVLSDIRDLIGDAWPTMEPDERAGRVLQIRAGLRALYEEADTGVLSAPAQAQATRRQTLALVLVASLVSAAICMTLSIWSTKGVIARLRELRNAMVAKADGSPTPEPRDVGGVVTQLEELSNRMALKIEEKNRELLRRERMAGVGLLAADVAHEINNPMNAMLGLTELSLRATAAGPIDERTRQELHESLGIIRREAVRCRAIVQRLMAMVRGSRAPETIDVSRLLSETVDIARAARPDRASCYTLAGLDSPITVTARSDDIRQIMLTLLINAADAVGPDGRIEVDATRAGKEVWLRVRDNGRGISADALQNIGVPFATTRAEQGGTGLGLSIATSIAADMGAQIKAESAGPGRGTLFILAIPVDATSPSTGDAT
ncbi:MAG: sensor histidine kinase, partial [Phycisphaerales bacterium JB064]